MKKHFFLLIALLLTIAGLSQNASAQSLPPAAGTYDWQTPIWGPTGFWPGRTAPGGTDSANISSPVAYVLNNAAPAFPIGTMTVTAGATVLVNPGLTTGELRIAGNLVIDGNLTIGSGLTVIVDGVIDGGGVITVGAGGTLRLNRTTAPAITGNVTFGAGSANGIIAFANGYNGGRFPFEAFGLGAAAVSNELQVNGSMFLDGPLSLPTGSGGLLLNSGTFTVRAGQTLTMQQTAANTLRSNGGLLGAEALGVVALSQGFNANNLPGNIFTNPFTGTLRLVHTAASTLNLQSTLTLGPDPRPAAAGNGGVLDLAGTVANSGILSVNAGVTLRLNSTQTNALVRTTGAPPQNTVQTLFGATVETGPGYNGGVIPFTVGGQAAFQNIAGTFRNLAQMQVNVNGGVNPFAATGTWNVQGDITMFGVGALSLGLTGLNSLSGTGRFIAQTTAQTLQFLPGANGGRVPGARFIDPYEGGLTLNGGGYNLDGRLNMGNGTLSFNNAMTNVLLIQPNSELRLTRTVNAPAPVIGNQPVSSYIQGVNNTAQLTLGAGFNGGALLPNTVSFLPLSTSTPDNTFNGRLNLEGSLLQGNAAGTSRALEFGAGSRLVLGSAGAPANLTVTGTAAPNAITLGMTGINSVSGTGVLQGAGNSSSIALRTGFNNGIIPGSNFAEPFLGFLEMRNVGPLELRDSLRIGQNGAVAGGLLLVAATDVIKVRQNAYLRINPTVNGVPTAANGGFGALGDGTNLGFIDAVDTTSRVVFGTNAAGPAAGPGNVRGIRSPFPGMLELVGGTMNIPGPAATFPGLSIGTTGGLINDAVASVPAATSLVLNNIGANTFRGVGTLNTVAATSTLIIGPGFNGGGSIASAAVIPGFRFATNQAGLVTVTQPAGQATMNGVLQFGVTGTLNMTAGSTMTLDPAAVLTFTTNTNDPISGTGRIQGADNTSIIRLNSNATTLDMGNVVSPFNGRIDFGNGVIPGATGRITSGKGVTTMIMNTGSIFNVQAAGVSIAAGGTLDLRMTGVDSFVGAAAGFLDGDNALTSVVNIRTSTFNSGIMPGRLFGDPAAGANRGFKGRMNFFTAGGGGTLQLTSLLSFGTNSRIDMNGAVGAVLQINDGTSLSLPAVAANVTQPGSGVFGAQSSNGFLVVPDGIGVAGRVNGNFFANPFRGSIIMQGAAAANTLTNTLVLGDATGTNGALSIGGPAPAVMTLQASANLTLNNKAPAGIVLLGAASSLAGTTGPTGSNIILGDGALAGIIPGDRFARPLNGYLVTTAPTPMTLPTGTTLSTGAGAGNGVNFGSDVLVQTGASLALNGAGEGTFANDGLRGAGFIQGQDNNSSVTLGGAFRDHGFAGHSVDGCRFGAPAPAVTVAAPAGGAAYAYTTARGFNGTLEVAAASTLNCRLIMGDPGSSFGTLNLGGNLTIPAAVSIAQLGFGGRNLVLNNIQPLANVLLGAGLIEMSTFPAPTGTNAPVGVSVGVTAAGTNVNLTNTFLNPDGSITAAPASSASRIFDNRIMEPNLYNGVLTIGPPAVPGGAGALGGTIPATKLVLGGGVAQMSGTLISSTGTYSLDQSLSFGPTGRLILGGTARAHAVTIPAARTVTITNTRFDAITGGTTSVFGAAASGVSGITIPGTGFQTSSAGTLLVQGMLSFGTGANGAPATAGSAPAPVVPAGQGLPLNSVPTLISGEWVGAVGGSIAITGRVRQTGSISLGDGSAVGSTATGAGQIDFSANANSLWQIQTQATLTVRNTHPGGAGLNNGPFARFTTPGTSGVAATTGTINGVFTRGVLALNRSLIYGLNTAAAGETGGIPAGSIVATGQGTPGFAGATGINVFPNYTVATRDAFDGDLIINNAFAISLATAAAGKSYLGSFAIMPTGGLQVNANVIVGTSPNGTGTTAGELNAVNATSLALYNNVTGSFRSTNTTFDANYPTVAPASISQSIIVGPGFNGTTGMPAPLFGTIPGSFIGRGGTVGAYANNVFENGTTTNTLTRNFRGRLFILGNGSATAPTALNLTAGGATGQVRFDLGSNVVNAFGGMLVFDQGPQVTVAANVLLRANATSLGSPLLTAAGTVAAGGAPSGFLSNGTPRGAVLGTNQTSILALEAFANTATTPTANDLTLAGSAGISKIGIGAAGFPAFNGTLRIENNLSVGAGETVAVGTAGALELSTTDFFVIAGGLLRLNNTAANSVIPTDGGLGNILMPGSRRINAPNAGGIVELGTNFNGSTLRATNFVQPFQGTVRMSGPGNLNTAGNFTIGNLGSFDFVGTSRSVTLGADTLTSTRNAFLNRGATAYVITNGNGVVAMGNVGAQEFPVGTAAAYLPVNISNSGAPDTYRARVTGTAPSPATPRPAYVNNMWIVSKATNTPAAATTVTPSWPATLHVGGFTPTRTFVSEVVGGSYANTTIVQSAGTVPGLTNYFQGLRTTSAALTNTAFAVFSDPTPTVTSVTPNFAYTGDTVTVNGSNFSGVTGVTFGGVTATIISQTATSVRVRVPAGLPIGTAFNTPAGTAVAVTVTQTGGLAGTANAAFTSRGFRPAPVLITSVVPNPIPSGIGDVVITINGASFSNVGANVRLAGNSQVGNGTILSVNPTQVSIRVPGAFIALPGNLQITLRALDRLDGVVTVPVAPSLAPAPSRVNPASVKASLAAVPLTIFGKNIALGSVITYQAGANTFALPIGSIKPAAGTNPDTVAVTLPKEANIFASVGNLVIRNLDGQAGQIPFSVTAADAPVILALSPSQAVPGGPEFTLTINGTGFQDAAVVQFSNQTLPVVSRSATQIQIRVPASLIATPGLLVVKITNNDGQEVGARFPVTQGTSQIGDPSVPTAPFGLSFTPSGTTATTQAFTVIITGPNLGNVNRASLGSTELRVISASANEVRVEVPAGAAATPNTFLFTLTNADGNSKSVQFVVGPNPGRPTIADVSPNSGVLQQPNTPFNLTIDGSNFAQGVVVQFVAVSVSTVPNGQVFSVNPSSFSPTRLVASVPTTVRPGEYMLRVVNPDGQFAEQTYVINRVVSVVVDNKVAMTAYPNPALEVVTVDARFEKPVTVTIKVTDILGKEVLLPITERAVGAYTKQINVSSLPSGTYMIDITDGTNRTVKSVVKN